MVVDCLESVLASFAVADLAEPFPEHASVADCRHEAVDFEEVHLSSSTDGSCSASCSDVAKPVASFGSELLAESFRVQIVVVAFGN